MATLTKKTSTRISELFPEHVRDDCVHCFGGSAGIISFVEKYYEFLESAELVLESIGAVDQVLLEEGTDQFIVQETASIKTDAETTGTGRIIQETSDRGVFVNDEIITGDTSKATATVRVEDINSGSRLFISTQNKFIIGEEISGGTSGANAVIKSYRANPVENITDLMQYADVDDTVDTFFDQFKSQFLKSIPKSLATGINKRKLLKNIKDLYRVKGTKKAHELFFRILLDDTAELYYPAEDMLRVSDGKWGSNYVLRVVQNDRIAMEDIASDNIYLELQDGAKLLRENTSEGVNTFGLEGQTITQAAVLDKTILGGGAYVSDGYSTISKATAVVEFVVKYRFGDETISELYLSRDTIVGTFIAGQPITAVDKDNANISITANIIKILTDTTITTTGQYYATTDPIVLTSTNGQQGICTVGKVTPGTISEIVVNAAGTNYAVDDVVTVDNTNTDGSGLTAVVSIVNGGFAPETGSLIEQFRFTLEAEVGELITEDSTPLYFTQEENYGMVSTDHIVLESETVYADGYSGDKIVQEGTTGPITDVRVTSIGENYTSLPKLSLPTTGSRSGGTILAKGVNVGKIEEIQVGGPGIHYTDTVTATIRNNFLCTTLGSFTVDETVTGNTSGATGTFKASNSNTNVVNIYPGTGTFTIGETITGAGSGATAVIESFDTTSIDVTTGALNISPGIYTGQDGFISEDSKKIQDSYYYQQFSYVIKLQKSIVDWRNEVQAAVHPSGFALFGQVNIGGSADDVLDMQIKTTAPADATLEAAREKFTPELLSLFETIFATKLPRRLGGDDSMRPTWATDYMTANQVSTSSQTLNSTPTTGIGYEVDYPATNFSGDRDVTLWPEITVYVSSPEHDAQISMERDGPWSEWIRQEDDSGYFLDEENSGYMLGETETASYNDRIISEDFEWSTDYRFTLENEVGELLAEDSTIVITVGSARPTLNPVYFTQEENTTEIPHRVFLEKDPGRAFDYSPNQSIEQIIDGLANPLTGIHRPRTPGRIWREHDPILPISPGPQFHSEFKLILGLTKSAEVTLHTEVEDLDVEKLGVVFANMVAARNVVVDVNLRESASLTRHNRITQEDVSGYFIDEDSTAADSDFFISETSVVPSSRPVIDVNLTYDASVTRAAISQPAIQTVLHVNLHNQYYTYTPKAIEQQNYIATTKEFLDGYSNHGPMWQNISLYRDHHLEEASVLKIELETATDGGTGDVLLESATTSTGQSYIIGDGWRAYRGTLGFLEARERTTLNEGGTLSASDTTITVTDGTIFPSSGTILIDDEQISYTGKSTHNLTGCTRGVNNTTAATHADGSGVKIMRFIASAHGTNNTYRIQDVGNVLLNDVINNPKARGHIPAPAEITIELRS
tara:strand:+ start:2641 stop:6750 length:4110 start_codon:yes stop_codon:yes gene_type:complete